MLKQQTQRTYTDVFPPLRVWVIFGIVVLCLTACAGIAASTSPPHRNYRQEMRDLVQVISDYAKKRHPIFIIIPQNGHELLSDNGQPTGNPSVPYLHAIDGIGQESLFYGYDSEDEKTPEAATRWLTGFLDIAKHGGRAVLVTDYCRLPAHVDDAFSKNRQKGYIPFTAPVRALDRIPAYPVPRRGAVGKEVTRLSMAKNFLYLINPGAFESKKKFLKAVADTHYDLLISDLFFNHSMSFTADDVAAMKFRTDGSRRLVVAYMSIGEAEDYRYYWKPAWKPGYPSWMEKENPDWPGNFKVRYWEPEWQKILFGNGSAYLDKIIAAGFDGVYLDIIDAFEHFEQRQRTATAE